MTYGEMVGPVSGAAGRALTVGGGSEFSLESALRPDEIKVEA